MSVSEPCHLRAGAAGNGWQVEHGGLALRDGLALLGTQEAPHVCGGKAEGTLSLGQAQRPMPALNMVPLLEHVSECWKASKQGW